MTRRGRALPLALAAALAAAGAPGAEAPPAQGTRLEFERTLVVETAGPSKIFAETRRIGEGENLRSILARDYRIPEDALPQFLHAFRELNPGADPEGLAPGQVVRVPFKLEERPGAGPAPERTPASYTVRRGDSLWKVLAVRYGVPRERMGEALAAVAAANPKLRDLNLLHVGQRIVIPDVLRPAAAPAPSAARTSGPVGSTPSPGSGAGPGTGAAEPRPAVAPAAGHRPVLDLLVSLGCQVTREGELFLPLGRGRALRLDAREFPVVSGPAGGKVILDPLSRMTPATAKTVREEWGYQTVSGVAGNVEDTLARVLPHLGFHELSERPRAIDLGGGAELAASARWTVIPRAEDLWEGKIHLLFAPGPPLDPGLVALAGNAGFACHALGSGGIGTPGVQAPPAVPELSMDDPAEGVARLLGLLGVPHQVRPVVDCTLAGGVPYSLRPDLVFRHAGLNYAVPPRAPARSEELLSRAGYLPVPWPPGAAPLNVLEELLAVLGVPHTRASVEVPRGALLRLRLRGLVVDDPKLAGLLYPTGPSGKLILTEAPLPDAGLRLLASEGVLPWRIR